MKHLLFNAAEGVETPWVTLDANGVVHYSGGSNDTPEEETGETNYVYISLGYDLNPWNDGTRLDYTGEYEYDGKTYSKFAYSYIDEESGERVTSTDDDYGFVLFSSRNFTKLEFPLSVEVLQGYIYDDGEEEIYPFTQEWSFVALYGYATEQDGNTVVIEHHDTSSSDKNSADFVDLGLPSGTLWATMNVGTNNAAEYGKYFAWGETEGYYDNEEHSFDWDTYKYSNEEGNEFSKYNTGLNDIGGDIDNKTSLDLSDDAVHASMGGDWKMPTVGQMAELMKATDNEWVEDYEGSGINGRLFTSKANGNSIFIPASGNRWGSSVGSQGKYAYLWSSALSTNYPYNAWSLYFNSDGIDVYDGFRYIGFCARGVI